jgi:hypothetical protein
MVAFVADLQNLNKIILSNQHYEKDSTLIGLRARYNSSQRTNPLGHHPIKKYHAEGAHAEGS